LNASDYLEVQKEHKMKSPSISFLAEH